MKKVEYVNTFILDDPESLVPMPRPDFYAEQMEAFKKGGVPTRAVDIANVFIFNSDGELLVQKRSNQKNHNPGLLDKSIGAHVTVGDNPHHTVMVETVQELQTPSIVLANDFDFSKTLKLMGEYTETIALIKPLDSQFVNLTKIIGGEEYVICNRTHLYVGVYNGRTRLVDKEAKGILLYSIDDLKEEIDALPGAFTDDLKQYLAMYEEGLRKFVKFIKAGNYARAGFEAVKK